MKKLYFFSKEKLQFIEIKSYKSKLFVYFSLSVITFSSLLFGGYFYLLSLTGSLNTVNALKNENRELAKKLSTLVNKYDNTKGNNVLKTIIKNILLSRYDLNKLLWKSDMIKKLNNYLLYQSYSCYPNIKIKNAINNAIRTIENENVNTITYHKIRTK